ncbi:O-antigen ligase family protein [Dysgonomonas mossii]|uniref:O-antigen ligase family protein n=1 Tax=Dysgonomonas mossii TaxID=163665 RepID=UPI0039952ADF
MINRENIASATDFGLILFIPVLPFLYQFDYYFNQIFIAFFISLALCFIRLISLKKISISGIDIVLFAFLLVYILNVLLIRNGNLDELEYYKWGALIFIYILARTFDRKKIDILWWAIVVSGLLQSIVAFLQDIDLFTSHHNYFKVVGYFSNPGLLGCYLAVSLSSALYLFIKRKNLYSRVFLSAAIVFIAYILVLSDSRASWLACISGISFIILNTQRRYYKYQSKLKNKIIYVLSGVSFIAIIIGGLYFYKKDSADARLLIWTVSKDIICDAPITGDGINRFPAIYMNYQGEYFKKNPDSVFRDNSDDNTQAFNE